MAVACLVFALEHRLDIHPVSGVEHLRLLASHHLKVVELEPAVEASPRVEHQCATHRMVAVGVDGPVGEHHVGVLAVDEFAHLLISLQVHLRVAVNLAHENVPCASDAAGVLALHHTNGSCLVVALASNSCLAAGEVDTHHLMAGIGEQTHRATAARLRVIGVRPNHQDLAPSCVHNLAIVTRHCWQSQNSSAQSRSAHVLYHFTSIHGSKNLVHKNNEKNQIIKIST